FVEAQQVDVPQGDLGEEGERHGFLFEATGQRPRCRSFHRAGIGAPEIQLVAGAQAQAITRPTAVAEALGPRSAITRGACISRGGGKKRCSAAPELGIRSGNSRRRGRQIGIIEVLTLNQAIESGAAVSLPPFALRKGISLPCPDIEQKILWHLNGCVLRWRLSRASCQQKRHREQASSTT